MNVGFIGTGNMATAIIGGLLEAGLVEGPDLYVSDASQDALDRISPALRDCILTKTIWSI